MHSCNTTCTLWSSYGEKCGLFAAEASRLIFCGLIVTYALQNCHHGFQLFPLFNNLALWILDDLQPYSLTNNHANSLHLFLFGFYCSRFVSLLQAQHEPIEMTNLLSLRALQHLSLDMSDLSDQLLVCLTEGCHAKLRSLTLNLLHHKEGVRQVANRTWRLIHQR